MEEKTTAVLENGELMTLELYSQKSEEESTQAENITRAEVETTTQAAKQPIDIKAAATKVMHSQIC